jgi:hypothetical protein
MYSFWHPEKWSVTKPQSSASCFALCSTQEGILLEVFVLGDLGATKVATILRDSLAETHPDRRIIRETEYQQAAVDDRAAVARLTGLGLTLEKDRSAEMEPPVSGYRFTVEYGDRMIQPRAMTVNTTTDYFSLQRNNFVLQLNFKTFSGAYAKWARQFEIVAASARLGIIE